MFKLKIVCVLNHIQKNLALKKTCYWNKKHTINYKSITSAFFEVKLKCVTKVKTWKANKKKIVKNKYEC